MTARFKRLPYDVWDGLKIPPGGSADVQLDVGESYFSSRVSIPIHVRTAREPGPVLFVTAALHGDEINGTGAIRQLIREELELLCGAVLFIPVLNILAFDRHSRYLPDRRDLNRSFPGSLTGSLASRFARQVFNQIVMRCDYGIDLHTASVRRTNFPNVRADLSDPRVALVARAFGGELIINDLGPRGGLRREACRVGCHTIVLEGGEVWKVEPSIVESASRGIKNILQVLKMLPGECVLPKYQVTVEKSTWIRAERGGFLQFHVQPGDIVEVGQPLTTNTTLLGRDRNLSLAPFDAVVIGMTTMPSVRPGEPICHLGKLPEGTKPEELRRMRSRGPGLEQQISDELATNVMVVEPGEDATG